MKQKTLTLEEIRKKGLRALARDLGPDGLIRFLQLYGVGTGDYTKDRHLWLDGLSLDDIMAGIEERRRTRRRRPAKTVASARAG